MLPFVLKQQLVGLLSVYCQSIVGSVSKDFNYLHSIGANSMHTLVNALVPKIYQPHMLF